jgi:hypothetical protein
LVKSTPRRHNLPGISPGERRTVKKTTRKFQLHRETLLRLEPAHLRYLAGGQLGTGGPAPTHLANTSCAGMPTCYLTCTL